MSVSGNEFKILASVKIRNKYEVGALQNRGNTAPNGKATVKFLNIG